MKLGPLNLSWPFRLAAPAPDTDARYQPPGATANTPDRVIGASGTVNLNGWLQVEEYLDALKDATQRAHIFDQMVRSDAAIAEAFGHITYPILNGNWTIEAASEDPDDHEIAEFVRCAYFEWLDQPFHEYIRESLSYLQYGHAVFEHSWKVVEHELHYDDPDPLNDSQVDKPKRQFLTFSRFGIRLPRTLWKWHVENGELQTLVQRVWKDETYITVEIPADQLVVYTNQRIGDDFTGISLLRSAYQAWTLKQVCQKVLALAIQRHGIGIDTVYMPLSESDDPNAIQRVEQMLQGITGGDSRYMIFPKPQANGQMDGYRYEIVTPQSGGENLGGITGALEYFRGEIKGSVLARFSELGHGSTGARATGMTQSEPWYDALRFLASYIGEANQPAIKRLVDANYPGVAVYPKLVCHDIEAKDLAGFAQGIAQILAAGGITADKSFRGWVRKMFDAPDEDEVDEVTDQTPDQNPEPDADDLDGPNQKPPVEKPPA